MAELVQTTIQGTLSTSSLKEIFIMTLPINNTGAQPLSVVATGVGAAFKTAWTAIPTFKNTFATNVIFTECTAARVLDSYDGDLTAAAHAPFSPTLPGVGSNSMPSQNAVAVSFAGGAKVNGTPYRGRHYLPTPATSVPTVDGTLQSTTTDLIRSFYLSWFANLAAGGYTPVIWSRKDGNYFTISQVRVGNKVDTIRRRRNELPETYSVGTLSRSDGTRPTGDPQEDLSKFHWRTSDQPESLEGVSSEPEE